MARRGTCSLTAPGRSGSERSFRSCRRPGSNVSRFFAALFLVCAASAPAQAQYPASDPPTFSISLTAARKAEHYRYRFENPTTFNTVELVPHFFEQKYDSDATWLFATARYRLLDGTASTEIGFGLPTTTIGSDFDTFFLPSGDIVTTGTEGDVRLRSFSIQQRLGLSTWRTWTFGVTIGYRQSRAIFRPADRVVTHTQPPSVTREFTSDRETTWSHIFESGVTADFTPLSQNGRRLSIAMEALPLTRARLTISLPDKYPENISGDAVAFGARGRVTYEQPLARVTIGGAAALDGVWGYQRASKYDLRGVAGIVFVRIGGL